MGDLEAAQVNEYLFAKNGDKTTKILFNSQFSTTKVSGAFGNPPHLLLGSFPNLVVSTAL
jgi:hypothetical protein